MKPSSPSKTTVSDQLNVDLLDQLTRKRSEESKIEINKRLNTQPFQQQAKSHCRDGLWSGLDSQVYRGSRGEENSYLGPAIVLRAHQDYVELDTPKGKVRADLALAFPYNPSAGDNVLVIGNIDYYVIGMLRTNKRSSFVVPGDLEVRAKGKIEIIGEEGLEFKSPRMTVRADRIETIARISVERFIDHYRWVKELTQSFAGRIRMLVDGNAFLSANRIVQKAKKDVRIDGERINLG